MARKRAESVDQRSFWALGTADAPENCVGRRFASPETGRMLAFAPFQGVIRGMSVETRREVGACRQREDLPAGVRALYDRVHNRSMRECT